MMRGLVFWGVFFYNAEAVGVIEQCRQTVACIRCVPLYWYTSEPWGETADTTHTPSHTTVPWWAHIHTQHICSGKTTWAHTTSTKAGYDGALKATQTLSPKRGRYRPICKELMADFPQQHGDGVQSEQGKHRCDSTRRCKTPIARNVR